MGTSILQDEPLQPKTTGEVVGEGKKDWKTKNKLSLVGLSKISHAAPSYDHTPLFTSILPPFAR